MAQDAARRTAADRAGGGRRQRRCLLCARAAAFASGPRRPRGDTPCSPRRAGPQSARRPRGIGEDPSSLPRRTASRGACLAPGAARSVLTRVRREARPVHGVRSGAHRRMRLRRCRPQHLSRCVCVCVCVFWVRVGVIVGVSEYGWVGGCEFVCMCVGYVCVFAWVSLTCECVWCACVCSCWPKER